MNISVLLKNKIKKSNHLQSIELTMDLFQIKIKKEIAAHIKSGLLPVFVIMHPDKDRKLGKRMAKRFKGICAPSLTPSEFVTLATLAEFAIGNRYHLLYAAKRAGVPIIPFGNDPKIVSLRYDV